MTRMLRNLLLPTAGYIVGAVLVLPLVAGIFWATLGLLRAINRHPWMSWLVLAVFAVTPVLALGASMQRAWQRRQDRLAERPRGPEVAPLELDSDPGERLQTRIEAVNEAFSEAATLMDELRRDVEAQQAVREALLVEAERQQKLLDIDREQAEKIRQILVGETEATIRAERRQQWMFFALGTLMSIPIGVAINLFVP